MHRTARLPEIDRLESGRRPSDCPKMPLGFLNEVEQRVSLLVGLGQGGSERALERDKRSDQVTPMVNRAYWRAHASQAVGGCANAFPSGFHGFVVDDRALAGDRALQQKA
jgi:hypothetical protein